jgi:hypothetical protein
MCAHAGGEVIYPRGKYARYTLTLPGAAERGGTLTVHFHSRDDKLTVGWATTDDGAGSVGSHSLRREGTAVAGHVTAVVGSVQYDYDVRAGVRGKSLAGRFTGKHGMVGSREDIRGRVAGELQRRASSETPVRLDLNLSSLYTRGHIRNPSVSFTLRGGKAADGRFFSLASQRRGFAGRFDGGTLTLDGGRLRGAVLGTVVGGDATPGTYRFALDANVVCNFVSGSVSTQMAGADWGIRPMAGTARGLAPARAEDGVYVLKLGTALEGTGPLTVYLDRRRGAFGQALARGGNTMSHKVNARGLKLKGGRIQGRLEVTIVPTESFPPGGRPVPCAYAIDAHLREGKVTGTFRGSHGVRLAAEGKLSGTIRTADDFRLTSREHKR